MAATRSGVALVIRCVLQPAAVGRGRPTIAMPACVGGGDQFLTVEHQRLAGIDRQRGRAGRPHRRDRREADDRHVEAHVLVRLGHLDDARAGPGQPAGPLDHRVGPLHRLHGDHGGVLHDDRLADVEARDRVGHAVAEREVRVLLGRRPPRGDRARRGEQRREEGGGVEQLDAVIAHDVGDRRDERVGVPRAEAHHHREQQAVGQDAREDLDVLDLAGHHRVRGAGRAAASRCSGSAGRATARRSSARGSRAAAAVQVGRRFFLDGDDRHLVPEAAGRVEHEEREGAVAGDQADAHRDLTHVNAACRWSCDVDA